MSNVQSSPPPKLQPPGAGLPHTELLAARVIVGVQYLFTSQERSHRRFLRETQEILALVEEVDPVLASRRVLINRLRGLEDSSRWWSLYMTVDHLRIVNQSTLGVIRSLRSGKRPPFQASTAAVKPRDDIDGSVVPHFKAVCEELAGSFDPEADSQSKTTFAHPWFGERNAAEWRYFAAFHMGLHKKQMKKILEQLR